MVIFLWTAEHLSEWSSSVRLGKLAVICLFFFTTNQNSLHLVLWEEGHQSPDTVIVAVGNTLLLTWGGSPLMYVFAFFVHHLMPNLAQSSDGSSLSFWVMKMKNFIKSNFDSAYIWSINLEEKDASALKLEILKNQIQEHSVILFSVIYFFRRKLGDCAGYLFLYSKVPAKQWLKITTIAHLYLSGSWGWLDMGLCFLVRLSHENWVR